MNKKINILNLIDSHFNKISEKVFFIILVVALSMYLLFIIFKLYPLLILPFFLLSFLVLCKFEYGIYILVFFIPFSPSLEFVEVAGRTIGITFEYIMITIIIFIWLIKKLTLGKLTIRYKDLLIPLIIFILLGIGTLCTAYFDLGSKKIIGGIVSFIGLIEFLLLFILIVDSLDNPIQVRKTIYFMISAGIIVSFISLIQYIQLGGKVYRLEPIFGALVRGEAVKSNPNTYATYLMGIVFAGIVFGNINKWKQKFLMYVGAILSFLIIILTGSRSSLLATCGGLFLIGFIKEKRIILLLLIILIMVFTIQNKYSSRFTSIIEVIKSKRVHELFAKLKYNKVDWNRVSVTGIEGYGTDVVTGALRITQWKEGIRLISARPFWGYGYQMNKYYSYSPTAESYFLDIWIMFGFLGFAILLYIFWILWKIAWSLRTHENLFIRKFSLFYLAFLLGIIIISLTGSVMFSPKIASYFWILSGLLIVLKNEKNIVS